MHVSVVRAPATLTKRTSIRGVSLASVNLIVIGRRKITQCIHKWQTRIQLVSELRRMRSKGIIASQCFNKIIP
jgi:hypothetical protein